jgi:hypothetical protein
MFGFHRQQRDSIALGLSRVLLLLDFAVDSSNLGGRYAIEQTCATVAESSETCASIPCRVIRAC